MSRWFNDPAIQQIPCTHGLPSDLSRRLPSTWAYVDQIGSRYCLMVWTPSTVSRQNGIGQYEIASVHTTHDEAVQALIAWHTARRARRAR